MMRSFCRKRFAWRPRPADAHDARPSLDQRGRLMLMMRGSCGTRFTRTPADADDARLLRDLECHTEGLQRRTERRRLTNRTEGGQNLKFIRIISTMQAPSVDFQPYAKNRAIRISAEAPQAEVRTCCSAYCSSASHLQQCSLSVAGPLGKTQTPTIIPFKPKHFSRSITA